MYHIPHKTAEFRVKHKNFSSCSAAKVICHVTTLALYLCFSVGSPSFYFLGPHNLLYPSKTFFSF